jgi:hypothetical protein
MSVDDGCVQRDTEAASEAKAHAAISFADSADGLHKLPIYVEHIT